MSQGEISPRLRADIAKNSFLSLYSDPYTAQLLSHNRSGHHSLMTMTMPTRRRSAHGTNPRDYASLTTTTSGRAPSHPFSHLHGRRFISAHVLRGGGGIRAGIEDANNGTPFSSLYHLDSDGDGRQLSQRSDSMNSGGVGILDHDGIDSLLEGIDSDLSFSEQRSLLLSKQDARRNDVFASLTSSSSGEKKDVRKGDGDESNEATAQFQLAQHHALQWQALLIRQQEQKVASAAAELASATSSTSTATQAASMKMQTLIPSEVESAAHFYHSRLDRSMSADGIALRQPISSINSSTPIPASSKTTSTSSSSSSTTEERRVVQDVVETPSLFEIPITSWNWNVFAIDLSPEEPCELKLFDYSSSSSSSNQSQQHQHHYHHQHNTSSFSSTLPPLPPPSPIRPAFHPAHQHLPRSPSLTAGESRLINAVESVFRSTQSLDLISHFNINIDTFREFVLSVRNNYHANAFHNFYHAVDVLQAVSCLCGTGTVAGAILTPLDKLAALLAALGHDLDHPGHNNGFEVASFSERALLHNDEAVLERHHAHTLWKLLFLSGATGKSNINTSSTTNVLSTSRSNSMATTAAITATTTTSPRPITTSSSSSSSSFSSSSSARFASQSSPLISSHSLPDMTSPSLLSAPPSRNAPSSTLHASPTDAQPSSANAPSSSASFLSHSCALLSGLSVAQLRDVRRISIRAILHTDMSLHFSTVAALLERASSSARVMQHATGLDDDAALSSHSEEVDVNRDSNIGGSGGGSGGGTLGRFSSEASVHSVVRRLESHDDVMLAQPSSSTTLLDTNTVGTTTSSSSLLSPSGDVTATKSGHSTSKRDLASSDTSPMLVHVVEEEEDEEEGGGDEAVTTLSASPSSSDDALFIERRRRRRGSNTSTTTPIPALPPPPRIASSSSLPLISSSSLSSKLAFAFDPASDAERSELVSVLVHLADLSGQSRPEKQRLNWGARIVAEFRHQAIKEKTQGLPVTPFMHALDTPLQAARLQMTFVSNIVLPLFRAVQSCGLLAVDDSNTEDGPIANLVHAEANYRKEEEKIIGEETSISTTTSSSSTSTTNDKK